MKDGGANALRPALGQGNPCIAQPIASDKSPRIDVPEVG